jgi:SpoVK/Ycf46/Vps4 family AAA+-type ATPase
VFDDVESILMARGSAQSKEWHYSQDSVFFHEIDDLDTSRTTVVLTTNRPDLVDDAVLDRFLHYRVPRPTADELVAVAVSRLRAQHLGGLDELAARVRAASADGDVRSFRQAEHLALRWHVARVTGHAFTNEAETGE